MHVKHFNVDLSSWYEFWFAIIYIDVNVIWAPSTAMQQFRASFDCKWVIMDLIENSLFYIEIQQQGKIPPPMHLCLRKIWKSNVKNIFHINYTEYFSYDIFSGIKSSITWNGNVIAQSPRKFRDISNTCHIRFIMVYRMIIDLILHLFIICYDFSCKLFLIKTLRHNESTVFGKMPQMCRGCPDVNKHWGGILWFF